MTKFFQFAGKFCVRLEPVSAKNIYVYTA